MNSRSMASISLLGNPSETTHGTGLAPNQLDGLHRLSPFGKLLFAHDGQICGPWRLTGAAETGGAGWTQNYGYDVLGNRWVTTNTNLPTLSLETPVASTAYSSTVPNRLAGWSYDLNGNVMQAGGTARNFTYDAENRQVTANLNGAVSNYSYDGNGLRVSKVAGGQTTTYVYDAWGNLGAEYSTVIEASACGTPTCYVAADHLGSTRMLMDSAGSSTVRRYDYLPFGQEILVQSGVATRTVAQGYLATADDTEPKFTGQQRDADTGLDWFQVRHMSGAAGRFQSVDPGNAGANAGDPQTWNGYSYVGNNPLSFTDPSGESWWSTLLGIGLDVAGFFTGGSSTVLGTILMTGGTIAAGTGTAGHIIDALAGAANVGVYGGGGTGGGNTGGVYGGGSSGSVVFNVIQVQASAPSLPMAYGIVTWDVARAYLMQSGAMARIIKKLEASKTVYHIVLNKGETDDFESEINTIRWDPTAALKCTTGGTMSPALALGHELAHALGPLSPWSYAPGGYDTLEERRVIQGPERAAARSLGECTRNNHRGEIFHVPSPVSR